MIIYPHLISLKMIQTNFYMGSDWCINHYRQAWGYRMTGMISQFSIVLQRNISIPFICTLLYFFSPVLHLLVFFFHFVLYTFTMLPPIIIEHQVNSNILPSDYSKVVMFQCLFHWGMYLIFPLGKE